MDYLATGNFVIDELRSPNAVHSNACGPVGYAYAGMRVFTDSCMMVANVGRDLRKLYGESFQKNGIPMEGLLEKTDFTNHIILQFTENGNYRYDYALGLWLGAINFGMLRIRPEDLEPFMSGVKGIYIDQPIETLFWEKMHALKRKYHFQIMWEVQYETGKELFFADNKQERIEQFLSLLKKVDMFSMNLREVRELFETEDDAGSIALIQALSTPCFLRAGSKGSYWIENGKTVFVPSISFVSDVVDAMGCGNCSTAAALVARVEGCSPTEICARANVAAAYNLEQYGPIRTFSDHIRTHALQAAAELAEKCLYI